MQRGQGASGALAEEGRDAGGAPPREKTRRARRHAIRRGPERGKRLFSENQLRGRGPRNYGRQAAWRARAPLHLAAMQRGRQSNLENGRAGGQASMRVSTGDGPRL